MVISHSYVNLPEGVYIYKIYIYTKVCRCWNLGLTLRAKAWRGGIHLTASHQPGDYLSMFKVKLAEDHQIAWFFHIYPWHKPVQRHKHQILGDLNIDPFFHGTPLGIRRSKNTAASMDRIREAASRQIQVGHQSPGEWRASARAAGVNFWLFLGTTWQTLYCCFHACYIYLICSKTPNSPSQGNIHR